MQVELTINSFSGMSLGNNCSWILKSHQEIFFKKSLLINEVLSFIIIFSLETRLSRHLLMANSVCTFFLPQYRLATTVKRASSFPSTYLPFIIRLLWHWEKEDHVWQDLNYLKGSIPTHKPTCLPSLASWHSKVNLPFLNCFQNG